LKNLKHSVRSTLDVQTLKAAGYVTSVFLGLLLVCMIRNHNLAWQIVQSWHLLLSICLGLPILYCSFAYAFKYVTPELVPKVCRFFEPQLNSSIPPARPSREKSLEAGTQVDNASRLKIALEELPTAPNLDELTHKAKRCLFYLDYKVEKMADDSVIEKLIDHLLQAEETKTADAISHRFLYLVENKRDDD
jgi:hypothetical protein